MPLYYTILKSSSAEETKNFVQLQAPDPQAFVNSIRKACNALGLAEPEITKMDTIAGDGDCGLTLKVRKLSRFPFLILNTIPYLGRNRRCGITEHDIL